MIAHNAVLGWQNAVESGALTASAETAGLPAINLRIPLGAPSEAWQTPASVLSAWVQIVPPSPVAWRAVCLARTNLTSAATLRVRVGAVASITSSPTVDVTVTGTTLGTLACLLSAATTAEACRLDIADAANPDGFINVPLLYAGPAWQMAVNFATSSTQQMEDGRRETVTRGGQQHIEEGWIRRGWTLDLPVVRASDAEQRLLDIERAARRGVNILCMARPASQPQRDTIFGQASNFVGLGFARAAGLRSARFTISERL